MQAIPTILFQSLTLPTGLLSRQRLHLHLVHGRGSARPHRPASRVTSEEPDQTAQRDAALESLVLGLTATHESAGHQLEFRAAEACAGG